MTSKDKTLSLQYLNKIESYVNQKSQAFVKEQNIPESQITNLLKKKLKIKYVSMKDFEEKIKNDTFIEKVVNTLIDLYKWKIGQYQSRINEIQKQIEKQKDIQTKAKLTKEEQQQSPSETAPKLMIGSLLATLDQVKYFAERLTKPAAPQKIRENLYSILEDPERGLKTLVGKQYDDIKNNICTVIASLEGGMKSFTETFQNITITGPAGVGKTTLGKYLSFYYHQSGILATDLVYVISRPDLVGQYLGESGLKTKRKLIDSLEAVIFIDEAYQLGGCPTEDPYGVESITELVNFLDKYMALSIVIVAGYQSEMEQCFFDRNEGLRRRFPNVYNLIPYEFFDLFMIFMKGVYYDFYNFFKSSIKDSSVDSVFNASLPTIEGIFESFYYLNNQNCKQIVKKKDEDGQYIRNPDGTYVKESKAVKCYFQSQGGDVGIMRSKFYNYYYSGNIPAISFIGAILDLAQSKMKIIPVDKLEEDINKIFSLFETTTQNIDFPTLIQEKEKRKPQSSPPRSSPRASPRSLSRVSSRSSPRSSRPSSPPSIQNLPLVSPKTRGRKSTKKSEEKVTEEKPKIKRAKKEKKEEETSLDIIEIAEIENPKKKVTTTPRKKVSTKRTVILPDQPIFEFQPLKK